MSALRRQPDGLAYGLMTVLCLCWGLQQVAVKSAEKAMDPTLQLGLRSLGSTLLVVLFVWARKEKFCFRPTLLPGLLAGLLFTGEFFAVSAGLAFTSASHMSVFLYTTPVFTAAGLHFLVKGEQLRPAQWAGIAVAVTGVITAFVFRLWKDGAPGEEKDLLQTLTGDALGILAALFWSATTLVIRKSSLSEALPATTLVYQLGMAAAILVPVSWASGHFATIQPGAVLWWSLGFQTVVVAFASFLVWFWILRTYLASRLSVFSFLTPVFGVLAGVVLLGEPLEPPFIVGAVLVLTGIIMVNRRPATS